MTASLPFLLGMPFVVIALILLVEESLAGFRHSDFWPPFIGTGAIGTAGVALAAFKASIQREIVVDGVLGRVRVVSSNWFQRRAAEHPMTSVALGTHDTRSPGYRSNPGFRGHAIVLYYPGGAVALANLRRREEVWKYLQSLPPPLRARRVREGPALFYDPLTELWRL